MTGISFVIPVRHAGPFLEETLASIVAQHDGRPMEMVIVDDHAPSEAPIVLPPLPSTCRVTVVGSEGRGAAAAVNAGIRAATLPIICQVDQDVVLLPGWVRTLAAALENPDVGAAQGCYVPARDEPLLSRVMGLDLQQRYAAIAGPTDHICTGNTAYRSAALAKVGLLDEALGYGYDNDLSYRLRAAGYELVICPHARSRHRWRQRLWGYLVQQYGFGYGRIDLVAKHPTRYAGDRVSPALMMAHPIVLAAALVSMLAALMQATAGGDPRIALWAGAILVFALMTERTAAGLRAWRQFGDPAALAFPVVHLARDLAWVAAILVWAGRRALRRPGAPGHSMRARASVR